MKYVFLLFFFGVCVVAFGQDKTYTFVFLNKKPDAEPLPKEQVDKLMQGHMANIERLAKEGKLLAAGPFDGGGGIFILNTTSPDEANEWLSTDPGIQAKRWNIELFPYKPRVGSICPVGEKYEMVTYHFIRFDGIVEKFTANTFPEIINKHNEFLKNLSTTGNVITEGIFGEHDGGILIMQGDLQKEVIESDPGVQEGLLNVTFRKLWIAKGSFCEK
ncbi:MAG TPA: YciI family protein [Ohtaekwangia sp.]